jgi:hypothetical protein
MGHSGTKGKEQQRSARLRLTETAGFHWATLRATHRGEKGSKAGSAVESLPKANC